MTSDGGTMDGAKLYCSRFRSARAERYPMDNRSIRIDGTSGRLELVLGSGPHLEIGLNLLLRLLRILRLGEWVGRAGWIDDHHSAHSRNAEVEVNVASRSREGQRIARQSMWDRVIPVV